MTSKSYTQGELTVLWTANRCIHSAKCVAGLPGVFDPARQPWIDLSKAEADAIRAQVRQCPTGALSLQQAPVLQQAPALQQGPAAAVPAQSTEAAAVSVELTPNGPLIVRGAHSVTLPDGKTAERKGPTAYCRCGASARKPYCDGAHSRIGFHG